MKVILSIVNVICICVFFMGIKETISSIAKGAFDIVPLIWTLVSAAVVALILFFDARGKKKTPPVKEIPKPSRDQFQQTFEARVQKGKSLLKALLVVGVLTVADLVAIVVSMATNMKKGFIPFMIVELLLYVVLLVIAVIYDTKYHYAKINVKLLERQQTTLDQCLGGLDEAKVFPVSHVFCTETAMVFENNHVVLPYRSIAWIYKKTQSANGVTLAAYTIIRCTTGEEFAVSVHDSEIVPLLESCADKLPKNLIVGYGSAQVKAYRALRKSMKNQSR